VGPVADPPYMTVRDQLTDEEIRAVREAFGWEMDPSRA
jgi:hypothetical protein